MSEQVSLYIHIPFCNNKCGYCDFFSMQAREGTIQKYVKALSKEIKFRSNKDLIINTIYFGGGTPSLLNAKQIEVILEAIRDSYLLSGNPEITIEANPEQLNKNFLQQLNNLGINRLSLGIQSFQKNILQNLHRDQGKNQFDSNFYQKLFFNIGSYFENISLDFMFGIPSQTIEDVSKDLVSIPDIVTHISYYALNIEQGTLLSELRQKGLLNETNEDMIIKMLDTIIWGLKEKNFNRYEISNFAKPGYESKHNLSYWKYQNYIGFGVGAVSTLFGIRQDNTKNLAEYMSGNYVDSKQHLTKQEQEFEYIMMNLRLTQGLYLEKFSSNFQKNFQKVYSIQIKKYRKYLIISDDRVFLTEDGLSLYNSIVFDFIL